MPAAKAKQAQWIGGRRHRAALTAPPEAKPSAATMAPPADRHTVLSASYIALSDGDLLSRRELLLSRKALLCFPEAGFSSLCAKPASSIEGVPLIDDYKGKCAATEAA